MRQLTSELGNASSQPIQILEDNQSAIALSKNPQFHGCFKHIAIKYHFVREQVGNGKVKLSYCPSKDMIADMLTKGLPCVQFEKLRKMAGVMEHSVCK